MADQLPGFEKVEIITTKGLGLDTSPKRDYSTDHAVVPWLGDVQVAIDVPRPQVSALTLLQEWSVAFQEWADGLNSARTRRAYMEAWRDFLTYAGNIAWDFYHFEPSQWFMELVRACGRGPWELDGGDVTRWANSMKSDLDAKPYTGEVHGNTKTLTFHHPTCPSGGRIPDLRRVTFPSAGDATQAGYRYCGKCRRTITQGAKLSDATRQQKMAAVSSFYVFACRRERYLAGHRTTLANFNPVLSAPRVKTIRKTRQIKYLTQAQVDAFMDALKRDCTTVEGRRNYALFFFYLMTGRRNKEIRTLTKGRITEAMVEGEDLKQYYWEGKRSSGWAIIHPDVWMAIQVYLQAAGRPWDTLTPEDCIFVALNDSASRLPTVAQFTPGTQPLSERTVGELFHSYIAKAGIETEGLTVHSLRHTVAMTMRKNKFDVRDIQNQLGQNSIASTEKYLHDLESANPAEWNDLGQLFSFTKKHAAQGGK